MCRPLVRRWGRLEVGGLEHVPATGPVIVAPNHDSQMDPVVVGVALRSVRRIRFLARASLWRIPLLGPLLDGMQQIPIARGSGDSGALDRAVASLRAGDAVGVFPEGRLTWGVPIRARSGIGLLARWCPDARVVLCVVEGATDFVRFPKRPLVRVRFQAPSGGQIGLDEDPAAFAARVLEELRSRVPPTPAGRARIVGGPLRIQRRLARGAAGD